MSRGEGYWKRPVDVACVITDEKQGAFDKYGTDPVEASLEFFPSA